MWLSFMMHMCKVIIFPGGFLIFFFNFDFSGCYGGGKSTKIGPKWQKILSDALSISGSIHHVIVIYVTPV